MSKKLKLILNKQTPKATREVDGRPVSGIKDKELMLEVLDFAMSTPHAIGLAANQLRYGLWRLNKRFFVYKFNGMWDVVANPRVVAQRGAYETTEACLTWPGRTIDVVRYSKIVVQYQDITGNIVDRNIGGREAQIFQHELDHLNGVEEKFIR